MLKHALHVGCKHFFYCVSCYSKTQDNFIICADFLKSVVKGYLKLFKLHSVGVFFKYFFVFGFCSKGRMYFNMFSDILEHRLIHVSVNY